MTRTNRELWAAFAAILLLTAIYATVVIYLAEVPHASGLIGHSLGVIGFVLMLMTETLYSIRKRSRTARWGRMANWLDFHIFTGIVGPYLVLLHSSWKFNGLAGALTLMTAIIVLSGFIGRYIYTSVPRTADGVALEASDIRRQIEEVEAGLESLMAQNPQVRNALTPHLHTMTGSGSTAALQPDGPMGGFRQGVNMRALSRQLTAAQRSLAGKDSREAKDQLQELQRLVKRQQTLRRQVDSLGMARRSLALWHSIHVPIGVVLFTAAFIHIVAAIYYATLLR